jgi:hypothetical protein
MTNDRMALAELLEKGSDGNVLCEMIGYVAQRLMDLVILESLALLSENPPIRLAAATTALDSTADELRLELLFPFGTPLQTVQRRGPPGDKRQFPFSVRPAQMPGDGRLRKLEADPGESHKRRLFGKIAWKG